MKKSYYFLLLFGLFFFTTNCEKDDIKFEDVVLTEGESDVYLGGWSGTETGDFYQDINYGFGNNNLPDRVDLTHLLPPVGDQGHTGTCVAWAVGYYTKTALDAQDGNLSPSDLRNPSQQHSPKDLFLAIPPNQKGPNCQGTHFFHALNLMQERGIATMQSAPFQNLGDCSSQPLSSWNNEAADNRIENYREIPASVDAIKEKLAEGRPVIWGAFVSRTFSKWASSQVMDEYAILDGTNSEETGHAMTIVGYDDARDAFRIVNSWGTVWGDNGFAWVSYSLMVNPAFSQYFFVAYNRYTDTNPENNNNNTNVNGVDLVIKSFDEIDNPDRQDPRDRKLLFDIKNQGNRDVDTWDGWNNVFIYYNAYNANDLGVIIHQRIDDWMGNPGDSGNYLDGLGVSNVWFNIELGAREELADNFFGPNKRFSWSYKMPAISGQYYLAMIADAFEEVDESNESNNIMFVTGLNGRPITFNNGVGNGFHSGDVDERHSERDPNAYTPDEIRQFIANLKASGRLKKMVQEATFHPPMAIEE